MKDIQLGDLYKAYRKAKNDAYFDRGHFNAVSYATYELDLEANLRKLLKKIKAKHSWSVGKRFTGGFTYLPKGIDLPQQRDGREIHFATLDPLEDWERSYARDNKLLNAEFRPVITPTVDYQVISALWIMKVGHKFDSRVNKKLAYAHSLKRVGLFGKLNEDSPQLFAPYFSGYRAWRSKGLHAIRTALTDKRSIIAVTMDVRSFYHSVSPSFLLRPAFLERIGVELSPFETEFTRALILSIHNWYKATPEYHSRPDGALPVGLSASRLISNVLLADFDEAMSSHRKTIHYGRYADDIFLVMEMEPSLSSGDDFIKWLRNEMQGYLVLAQEPGETGLRLRVSYARDSDIVFAGKKQKIFFLSGDHGLDLVAQIEEQIKQQSSEYRLLPELPESEAEMLGLALLATPDARLEADALRKAEAVSLRRLGFSFLLSDFEAYARDLDSKDPAWLEARRRFYGIVCRYLITPTGFFDYFVYIVRVFGLMVACRDFRDARLVINCLENVGEVLSRTTTAGRTRVAQFNHAKRSYYRGFLQAALESATVGGFSISQSFLTLLGMLSKKSGLEIGGKREVSNLVKQLLLADLGRRPYQEYWYSENPENQAQPPLPQSISVGRVLARTKEFREKARKDLNAPYWPAIAFPTRPPAPWQLSLSVPKALEEPGGLERLIYATRGGYVNPDHREHVFLRSDEGERRVWNVPSRTGLKVKIAVPSVEVTDEQWGAAIHGAPDHSLGRYLGVRRLINQMIISTPQLDYIVFPELSLPYGWALDIASRLAKSGISLIAGIENRSLGDDYRNDVLVSLASDFYGRRGSVCFVQSKIELSHEERSNVASYGKNFVMADDVNQRRPVYSHGEFAFGVLICSDLTAIQNRSHFQGAVDALFVVEWNKDVDTFGFLVESAAHDLHAAIVQVNNRRFGDSRIRLPFAEAYKRDVVKVKGGDSDYFVHCSVDAGELREFQGKKLTVKKEKPRQGPKFKPTPIGFQVSCLRKK